MPRPSLGTDGCAAAVLVPAEFVFGFGSALMVLLMAPGWVATAWLGVLVAAALVTAVVLFRRGYRISAAAQVLAVGVLLGSLGQFLSLMGGPQR
ncbi:hypothetical protein [Streptomyces sp. NPDC050548]|uniref:hypothetical protein n=1 Tax=Streptomyces sp. NPDC050548 TaxID=3365629 RepID=UPI00378C0A15